VAYNDYMVEDGILAVETHLFGDVPSLVMIIHRREQTRLKIPN
jgi:hypothetical protein